VSNVLGGMSVNALTSEEGDLVLKSEWSQCKDFRTGVMWSYLRTLNRTLAALF